MAKEVNINEVEILKPRIGSGSFGAVYLAILKTDDKEKKVAAKEISRDQVDYKTKQKIENEANLLSKVNHENIVKCFGLTKRNSNHFYILMEYADCGSLYDLLHNKKDINFSFRAILNWMLQCAKGMEYLHEQKIVHRDLKTQNLLLTDKYRTLKIADFGSAEKFIAAAPKTLCYGTIYYTAPEAFKPHYYDEKRDVYSFGIVLWEVLSRKMPFYHLKGGNEIKDMYKIMDGERPFLRDIKPYKNSGHLKQLIDECFDSNPKHRPTMQRLVCILEIDPDSIEPYVQKSFLQLKRLPKAIKDDFQLESKQI